MKSEVHTVSVGEEETRSCLTISLLRINVDLLID